MDREEVLLKEYEVAQHHINALNTQVWLATSIFLSANAVAIGYIFRYIFRGEQKHVLDSLFLLLVIGAIFIAVLCFWKRWIKRVQFIHKITFHRMREIEKQLHLWKNRYIGYLDKPQEGKSELQEFCDLTKKKTEHIKQLGNEYEHVKQAGFDGLQWIARILMIGWVLLIVLEFVLWLLNIIG